ncbi:MAG: hypothetical protein EBZ59_06035, partial [Planctomycetia bacterium]|nr:hypothetical protein [Planctomycetia bacterium]
MTMKAIQERAATGGRRLRQWSAGVQPSRGERKKLSFESLENRRVLAASGFIYGVAENNHIYQIDVDGKSATDVFDASPFIGSSPLSNGFAFDTGRGQFFFVAPDKSLQYWNGGPTLKTIATPAQLGTTSTSLPDNAAYYRDAFWFFTPATDTLNKVSLTYSGGQPSFSSLQQFTVTGAPTTKNIFGDIAINANTGMLYASNSSTNDFAFYSIDVSSGTPTNFTMVKAVGTQSLAGLSFSADYGTLYGQQITGGNWFTIDTTTGDTTSVPGFSTPVYGGKGFRDLGGAAPVSLPWSRLVAANDIGCDSTPRVYVINPYSGEVVNSFLAYTGPADGGFRGGVRVAIGDIDGNGIPDIVVAPGPGRAGEVKAFSFDGTPLPGFTFTPFGAGWRRGIELAVGDIDGDGKGDVVTSKSTGPGETRIATSNGTSFVPQPSKTIASPFPGASGGASVAVGGVGKVVLGSGFGVRPTVKTYNVSGANPVLVGQY